jgi:hypothetical protein
LVELLVVIAVIALLASVILPSLHQSGDATRTAWCANNLRNIGVAYGLRLADAQGDGMGTCTPTFWPSILLPYLDGQQEALLCQGDAAPAGGASRIADFRVKIERGDGVHYIDFFTVHMKQLSQEQYNAAGPTWQDWANYFANTYSGYVPGANPNVYWLTIEDWQTLPGGGNDYGDVRVKVTENEDGTVTLNPMQGHPTGYRHRLVFADTLMDALEPPGLLVLGDTRTRTLTGKTSYGMNAQAGRLLRSGKILVLDYETIVADSNDDWGAPELDPDTDGIPTFARHSRKANVLSAGGSVSLTNPRRINPEDTAIEASLWLP